MYIASSHLPSINLFPTQRLKVPAIRSVLEYLKWVLIQAIFCARLRSCSFLLLFVLFVVALELNERDRINSAEMIFMIYGLGFTLEKVAAMQEHGIRGVKNSVCLQKPSLTEDTSVFQRDMGQLAKLWSSSGNSPPVRMDSMLHSVCSFLDNEPGCTHTPSVSVYFTYALLRLYGVYNHSESCLIKSTPTNHCSRFMGTSKWNRLSGAYCMLYVPSVRQTSSLRWRLWH